MEKCITCKDDFIAANCSSCIERLERARIVAWLRRGRFHSSFVDNGVFADAYAEKFADDIEANKHRIEKGEM